MAAHASSLPFASIENESLRVDYLTSTGPRIIGLYAKGVEGNLFAETPDAHWSTPHGEYYLRGGHRLWTAPEDPFYTCPEDLAEVITKKDSVILRGDVDASGLQKEIAFCLDKNCIHVTHHVTWHGTAPIKLAPWAITQLRLGGTAILPQPDSNGLLPDRHVVFWPYSQISDARLELHDDLILVHGYAASQALKIGHYNSSGWIAYLLDHLLFVKRFSVNVIQKYPDMGCNAEGYVKDVCVELETLGSLVRLKPNEFVTHEETWEITFEEDPMTTQGARAIRNRLSRK